MAERDAIAASPDFPLSGGEPVFAEPWEARAFAMAVALNEAGLFTWPEWAAAFGANLRRHSTAETGQTYYEIWWQTLEAICEDNGLISAFERDVRSKDWKAAAARTPHGHPIEL